MPELRPFFSYYGSKWSAALHYPPPHHQTVVEPFAGSAGYSLRYPRHGVLLFDADPTVAGVWRYLIGASAAEIRRLPLLAPGQTVNSLGLPPGAAGLIGFWCNKATTRPRQTLSAWSRQKPRQFWGAEIRERIASQVQYISHWQVACQTYHDIVVEEAATWFVDPPYVGKGHYYRCGSSKIDYQHLARWCRGRAGHLIVCENEGAQWLPFRAHRRVKSANQRGGTGRGSYSNEVIYTTPQPGQLSMLDAAGAAWRGDG